MNLDLPPINEYTGSQGKFKNILAVVLLLLVVAAVPLGVYLVQRQQNLRPQANIDQTTPENSFILASLFSNCTLAYSTSYCNQLNLLEPYLIPGKEFDVAVLVRSDFDTSNQFKANLNFDPELLEVVSIDAPVVTPSPSTAPVQTFTFGNAGDTFLTGKFAGGVDSPVVVRDNQWFIKYKPETGNADSNFIFGEPADQKLVCDWDGDGISTPGIYRDGTFYLKNSNSTGNADTSFVYGTPGMKAICGDWDGDGKDTVGVISGNTIYLKNSNTTGNADLTFRYGNPTDQFIVGDWDGDGKDTLGVYRDANFYLRNSNTTGEADKTISFGQTGDFAISGDWDGDGTDDIGVVRGNNWLLQSSPVSSSPQPSSSTASLVCGGLQGLTCPDGYQCDYSNSATTNSLGADATGTCVESKPKVDQSPICLSSSTKISTPKGSVYVTDLKEGMQVYSVNKNGQKITSKILKVSSTQAPLGHQVVHFSLKDGRNAYISPNHPTTSGKTVGELKVGDSYDGSSVIKTELVTYDSDKTYDLLPDSETGFYFANGIEMASTLKGSVQGISTVHAQSDSGAAPDFITEWVTKTFDNTQGSVTLSGKAEGGVKTNLNILKMATVKFRVKKVGSSTISFADSSQMLRLSDALNILQQKHNMDIIVNDNSASPSPSSSASPCNSCNVSPSPSASVNPLRGDANHDGKVDLSDLSFLLTHYNSQNADLDFNSDGVVNALDYARMIDILIELHIIRLNS